MLKNRLFSNISLAQKAGRVASGEYATEMAVKSGKAYLVIVAEDASDNTKKSFTNMCEFYECDLVFYGKKENLGHAIGKEFRASVAITDENLAQAVKKKITLV